MILMTTITIIVSNMIAANRTVNTTVVLVSTLSEVFLNDLFNEFEDISN